MADINDTDDRVMLTLGSVRRPNPLGAGGSAGGATTPAPASLLANELAHGAGLLYDVGYPSLIHLRTRTQGT